MRNRRGQELAPGGTIVRTHLGLALLGSGDPQQALSVLEHIPSMSPSCADGIAWYGDALIHNGRPAEGLASVDRAIAPRGLMRTGSLLGRGRGEPFDPGEDGGLKALDLSGRAVAQGVGVGIHTDDVIGPSFDGLLARAVRRSTWIRVIGCALVLATGCASAPEIYHPTEAYYVERQHVIVDDKPQIEEGRPVVVLDALNHYLLSLPTKILLLNWQALDHELPPASRLKLERYLELNQLRGVKVRHNQYAPLSEWNRLRRNVEVGAGYRYTLGLLSWLQYTLLPDRLLAGVPLIGGGDHFNPFTNTINVYSSDIAILIHETGHAKDYVRHEMKGTSFAIMRSLPLVDLLQEGRASTDAVRFFQCIDDPEGELRAYSTLVPAYSTYLSGYVEGVALRLPILALGHAVGWGQRIVRGNKIESDREDLVPGFRRRDFMPQACKAIRGNSRY